MPYLDNSVNVAAQKTALITGASVGIGRAVALKMATKKINLVLFDIDLDGLKKVQNETESLGVKTLIYKVDVSSEDSVKNAVNDAYKTFNRIDILVNNAGIWRGSNDFLDTSISRWKSIIDVNLFGVVYLINAVLPKMIKAGYGRIVNVASVAGVYGNGGMSAYSASKGAVISLTKALAKEVAKDGVIVNSVSPGLVSPSEEDNIDYFDLSDRCYMGRTGTDRENADAIYFLCSDEVGYVVGQNIQVDGSRRLL